MAANILELAFHRRQFTAGKTDIYVDFATGDVYMRRPVAPGLVRWLSAKCESIAGVPSIDFIPCQPLPPDFVIIATPAPEVAPFVEITFRHEFFEHGVAEKAFPLSWEEDTSK